MAFVVRETLIEAHPLDPEDFFGYISLLSVGSQSVSPADSVIRWSPEASLLHSGQILPEGIDQTTVVSILPALDGVQLQFFVYPLSGKSKPQIGVRFPSKVPLCGNASEKHIISSLCEALSISAEHPVIPTDGIFEILTRSDVESMTCEMFGTDQEHLVRYDARSLLFPLYFSLRSGERFRFALAELPVHYLPAPLETPWEGTAAFEKLLGSLRREDETANLAYRGLDTTTFSAHNFGLSRRYGRQIFLCNDSRQIISGPYICVPPSIQQILDCELTPDAVNVIRAAVQSCKASDHGFSQASLRAELSRTFNRRAIRKWAKRIEIISQTILSHSRLEEKQGALRSPAIVILTAPPGAGKSYFSRKLISSKSDAWVRVNQDEVWPVCHHDPLLIRFVFACLMLIWLVGLLLSFIASVLQAMYR